MKELNWKDAKIWQDKANENKDEFSEPKWSWDCNFKLDFDGSLLRISSRFYPPHKNNSDQWEGDVQILFMAENLLTKNFKEKDLNVLKEKVEYFVENYSIGFKKLLKSHLTQKDFENL